MAFCYDELVKQIIWVYGTSAAGKDTFIKSLLKDAKLRLHFRLDKSGLVVSNESLQNLGKLDDSRNVIIDEVSKLSKSNDVIILKWQYGDTLLDSPNRLLDNLPSFHHRVIKLIVDEEEQVRRLRTKSWWHDIGKEKEYISREQELVDKSIKKLNPSFDIRHFDW